MKRQADGVRSSEDFEQTNDNKRIKLLKNESSTSSIQDNSTKTESMETSLNENSNSHNHEDVMPVISKNGSANENSDVSEKDDIPQHESPHTVNQNGPTGDDDVNHLNTNHNGSCNDEVVVKVSSSDSCIVTELYYTHTHGNSVINSDEKQLSDGEDSMPVLIHHDHNDALNSESTDSFQSEGFEAINCKDNEVTESCSSQEQEKALSVKESNIDIDNIMLSHVKVVELQGHTDVIFSVAADDDVILSASGDTTVRVWSAEQQCIINTFSGHSDCVTSLILLDLKQSKVLQKKLGLSKVLRIAVTGSLDCHIKLWSVLEGKELASVYTFNGITCIGYLEAECLIAVGTEGGKLELWDISSAKAVQSVHAHEDSVSDIKTNGNYIYTVSIDGNVKVWIFEEDDIYPVYTRKRKEISSDKTCFRPAHWKTVALSDNVMYLGDNTSCIKMLDWQVGRLRLFKNQSEDYGICEAVAATKNILFSTYYDSVSDTGGINVWKIPDMTYVCTLTGAASDICCLAVKQRGNILQIVSGGHGLLVWEFDFSRPPNSDEGSHVAELDTLGAEIDEKSVEMKNVEAVNKSFASNASESSSNNRWCNIM